MGRERERERNNFLGNGQMTGEDGDPWKKANRQGKAKGFSPGDSVQVPAQGPKQPRRLSELKWQSPGFREVEAANICGPLKRSCGNWICSLIPSHGENSWPRKLHWVDQAFKEEEITPILYRFSQKIIGKGKCPNSFYKANITLISKTKILRGTDQTNLSWLQM